MIYTLLSAFAGSRWGLTALIALAIVLGALGLRWRSLNEGIRKGRQEACHDATTAALERQERRREVDQRARAPGAAERLREGWSRD